MRGRDDAGKPPKEPLLGRLFSLAKGRKNEQLAPPEEGCFTVSNSAFPSSSLLPSLSDLTSPGHVLAGFEDRHAHLALRRSILERDRAALQQELELASERPRVGDAKPR